MIKYVCGSDGKTYDSECHLKEKTCFEGNLAVFKASDGKCSAEDPEK